MSGPDVRATQIVREVAANPTDAPVRATSLVREVAANPSDTPVRATSAVRETLLNPTDKPARVTSLVREALFRRPATQWTNPIGPGSRITASDVMEVVDAIDRSRLAAYLPVYPWTDPSIEPGMRIMAYHFTEMKDAMADLWSAVHLGDLPSWTSEHYTNGGVGSGKRIYASDLADVRWWINRYEGLDPPPAEQGIDTLSHGPDEGPGYPVISESWAQDVVDLRPTAPRLYLRCDVTLIRSFSR